MESRMAEEIVAALLFALVLIGLRVIHVLLRINETLDVIRDSLPDRVFRSDTEGNYVDIRNFWVELRTSMNRLARIHHKFMFGDDWENYLSEENVKARMMERLKTRHQ